MIKQQGISERSEKEKQIIDQQVQEIYTILIYTILKEKLDKQFERLHHVIDYDQFKCKIENHFEYELYFSKVNPPYTYSKCINCGTEMTLCYFLETKECELYKLVYLT